MLQYLLGFPNVKNYDGSWTEWGNMVGVPIAARRGAGRRGGGRKQPTAARTVSRGQVTG